MRRDQLLRLMLKDLTRAARRGLSIEDGMRTLQRNVAARLLISAAFGAVLASAISRNLPTIFVVFLIAGLALTGFLALTVAPDAIALQRGHYWRWWWRSSEDEGPFWPGTRIPRTVRWPHSLEPRRDDG